MVVRTYTRSRLGSQRVRERTRYPFTKNQTHRQYRRLYLKTYLRKKGSTQTNCNQEFCLLIKNNVILKPKYFLILICKTSCNGKWFDLQPNLHGTWFQKVEKGKLIRHCSLNTPD